MVDERSVNPRLPLTPAEKELIGQVDIKRDELIQLLKDLIDIDSRQYDPETYANMDQIFAFTEKYMQSCGCDAKIVRVPFPYPGLNGESNLSYPNLIATQSRKVPGPTLQFMGHLDTVPYNESKWDPETPPNKAVVKHESIHGRGAVDMKGGVACQMMAMKIIQELKLPLKGNIKLWFVPDEEIDGPYGARYMVAHHMEEVQADATIIPEPTGQMPIKSPAMILGEKGCQWYRLRFYGTSGHGSMPKIHSNALNKAARFMNNIKKMKLPQVSPPLKVPDLVKGLLSRFSFRQLIQIVGTPPEDDDEPDPYDEDGYSLRAFFKTTLSFNKINAGTKVNVIPDACDLEVDLRILPGIQTQQIVDAIVHYATRLGYRIELPEQFTNLQKTNHSMAKRPVDIELIPIATALGTFEDPNAPFVSLMGDAFESIYRVSKVFFFAPGSSDATHLRNGGMKNVVLFGPTGGNAHSANEYVSIDELINCTKLYLLLISRYLGQ